MRGKHMSKFKQEIGDYTENEFIELLDGFRNPDSSLKGRRLEKYWDDLMDHFIEITGHPKCVDLIAYPEEPGDDEPENIIKIVKKWRESQGLPLFKDTEPK